MQDVCAVRFADHLPSARPVYDPAKKCKDAVVYARQFVTFLMYLRLRRRAFGLLGVITQLRCFRGRAARTSAPMRFALLPSATRLAALLLLAARLSPPASAW